MSKTFSFGNNPLSNKTLRTLELKFLRELGETDPLPQANHKTNFAPPPAIDAVTGPIHKTTRYAVLAEMQEKALFMQEESLMLPVGGSQPNALLPLLEEETPVAPVRRDASSGTTIGDVLAFRFCERRDPLFPLCG